MFSFVYEAVVIIISGFVLLRMAGKKVMAEMTALEMVAVLSIGTVIGHAVAERKLWQTVVCIALFVGIVILFQYTAMRSRFFERLVIGRPTMVIRDGEILEANLSRLRMTMEQLEMRLRQKGIANISDVRTGTIEVNGRFGFELVESARPLTRGQAEQILAMLQMHMPESDKKTSGHDVFQHMRKSSK